MRSLSDVSDPVRGSPEGRFPDGAEVSSDPAEPEPAGTAGAAAPGFTARKTAVRSLSAASGFAAEPEPGFATPNAVFSGSPDPDAPAESRPPAPEAGSGSSSAEAEPGAAAGRRSAESAAAAPEADCAWSPAGADPDFFRWSADAPADSRP
ncbi:hypothetical protein ACWGIP_32355, partial [Streptomyces sp. NPDC054838]